jgi:23S rRNA maturation-related 3'-5' exoribonuclease YhaM
MTDEHYGWIVNTHYDWLNMLSKMEQRKPNRFEEFKYSKATIYHYLDRLQHEQNLHD